MKTHLAAAAFGLVLMTPAIACAQMHMPSVATEARSVSQAERQAAIASVLEALDHQYVAPERLAALRERLGSQQAAGRYDVADVVTFAERLSADMRETTGDGHLYIRWDPDQFQAAISDPEADDTGLTDVWDSRFRAMNYGLTEQRVLPGNVRYLRFPIFGWVNDETGAVLDAAMQFLDGGESAIIDLRGNGGGAHEAVRYILSHFMKPDELLITFLEAGKPPYPSRTLSHLPAGRMIGKPLFVLIDGRTASAGEEFAYSVQAFGLGTVVGQTTAGGANNNRFIPIAPGFVLSLSYAQPVHPKTDGNWEGTGVRPDVEVPSELALERAQQLARPSSQQVSQ